MGKYPHSPWQPRTDRNCQSKVGEGARDEHWQTDRTWLFPRLSSQHPTLPSLTTSEYFLACWESGEADRWNNNWVRLPALANKHQALTKCSLWDADYNWRMGRGQDGVMWVPPCYWKGGSSQENRRNGGETTIGKIRCVNVVSTEIDSGQLVYLNSKGINCTIDGWRTSF